LPPSKEGEHFRTWVQPVGATQYTLVLGGIIVVRYLRFTEHEKSLLWERWHQGDGLREIARLLERGPSSVSKVLQRSGGIQPAARSRSTRGLDLGERESISRGLASGKSFRTIAQEINRSPSTVSREVGRNGGLVSYRATNADQATWDRALRPKLCKLAKRATLVKAIARKLKQQWSPQQIAGWLRRRYPNNERYHVSHETIYKTLYIQARGVLKKELLSYLRSQRVMRRSRQSSLKTGPGKIVDAVSISERPASVEDRAIPGHWEGDLIIGTNNSCIATLVERKSRFVMLVKVTDKTTKVVIDALIKQSKKLPTELYKSLTWDRGSELADHKRFTVATDIPVFFCDPRSPWQRGSNENTNRLLRQYFPKGTDLSEHSQVELNRVARQLNERPRKTLDYETPAEHFAACVA
jgi:IS30 family transposase